jgi:hypothetical protein
MDSSNYELRFIQVKMAVFWVVSPCSLVEVYRRFIGAYCLHHQDDDYPYDGGRNHLWNVRKFLSDYTAQPIRQSSSYSPPWEPEISRMFYASHLLLLLLW